MNRNEGYTIGLILLGIVLYPMLAFGSATFKGRFSDPAALPPHKIRRSMSNRTNGRKFLL